MTTTLFDNEIIEDSIAVSLAEDIGGGDITAALIPEPQQGQASLITREPMIVCGQPWFDEVYRQVDLDVTIDWRVDEGESIAPSTQLAVLTGSLRSIVTGERCAMNWLQTLSGTATIVSKYAKQLENTSTRLLDTRKTIPGLRYAQKYAVRVGGGQNHRMGLYDAFLIKENHIAACGSLAEAVELARALHADKIVEVEVESMEQLEEALSASADIIMLDNFDCDAMRAAVELVGGRAKLEVSGNVEEGQLSEIAETGVDYISVGALTKHVRAIDLSMRVG